MTDNELTRRERSHREQARATYDELVAPIIDERVRATVEQARPLIEELLFATSGLNAANEMISGAATAAAEVMPCIGTGPDARAKRAWTVNVQAMRQRRDAFEDRLIELVWALPEPEGARHDPPAQVR